MNKISKIVLVIIVICVAIFLVWFGIKNSTTNKTIRLGLNPWIGNGLYYVAQQKGFFEKEGIKVELLPCDDSAICKQLLNTNKIDVLPLTPETAVVLADAGVNIKVVGMSDSSQGADGIIASKDIQTLSDLKGKNVAFEVGSPSHFLISYLLDKQGLTTKDLNVIDQIAPDAGASFVAGKVDAAVTWEPWLSKASERPGGHILVSSKELQLFPDMLIFRTDFVQNKSEDTKALLRALFATQEWITSNQDEAVSLVAQYLNITDQEVKEQLPTFKWLSYQDNLDAFNSGQAEGLIQKAGDLWLKLGLIKNKINASDLVDSSILKNLYK